jgi:hypothetical protein
MMARLLGLVLGAVSRIRSPDPETPLATFARELRELDR